MKLIFSTVLLSLVATQSFAGQTHSYSCDNGQVFGRGPTVWIDSGEDLSLYLRSVECNIGLSLKIQGPQSSEFITPELPNDKRALCGVGVLISNGCFSGAPRISLYIRGGVNLGSYVCKLLP